MMLFSISTLLGLGLVASILLAVASRVFHVDEDPRVEAVLEVLPGANCGGCGFAGCSGYAQAVVTDPDVPANRCCAGGSEISVAVGALTGKIVADTEPLYALRRCDKISGHMEQAYTYQGMPSCAAASQVSANAMTCEYSCLGYGDCVQVCPFDAMEIRNGMVHINRKLCTGCGTCISACPRGMLMLTPQRARVAVYCSTRNKGKAVTDVCGAGCIKCLRCVKICPAKAVSLEDDRIVIDQLECLSYGSSCGEACVKSCPRHILRYTKYGNTPLPPGISAWKQPAKETEQSKPAMAEARA